LGDTDREDHVFAEHLLERGGDRQRNVIGCFDVVDERH